LLKDQVQVLPQGGNTIRLSAEAMACEFSVVLNPGASAHLMTGAEALEIIHTLEDQMTVYREDSELSRLNRSAYERPVAVEPQLFQLLLTAKELWQETDGAFDPTSGPLIALWRNCRREGRIPTDPEITEALTHTGLEHVRFDEGQNTVRFDDPRAEFNLGGIGKGYALDRAGQLMSYSDKISCQLNGVFSSMLECGELRGQVGWPVGIRNPLLPIDTIVTIFDLGRSVYTSGS
jgi:thiamine biosynthesis lipoprotein